MILLINENQLLSHYAYIIVNLKFLEQFIEKNVFLQTLSRSCKNAYCQTTQQFSLALKLFLVYINDRNFIKCIP